MPNEEKSLTESLLETANEEYSIEEQETKETEEESATAESGKTESETEEPVSEQQTAVQSQKDGNVEEINSLKAEIEQLKNMIAQNSKKAEPEKEEEEEITEMPDPIEDPQAYHKYMMQQTMKVLKPLQTELEQYKQLYAEQMEKQKQQAVDGFLNELRQEHPDYDPVALIKDFGEFYKDDPEFLKVVSENPKRFKTVLDAYVKSKDFENRKLKLQKQVAKQQAEKIVRSAKSQSIETVEKPSVVS